uniref:Tachylectin 2 domain-containing protein n=1 Tax=Leptobrachium leishanense TaxID=445787 RepID=A0A8C5WDL0_9ANUR
MASSDALLFTVKDHIARAGLPPRNIEDSFDATATIIGTLHNVSKIAFSPDGELFSVRGEELYRGPMPSEANQDWFSTAKRVGKSGWEKLKFLLFDPKGLLYVVTMEGKLYKGPAPCNENVPWLKWQATLVGTTGWNVFDSLFFDLKGTLYAVIDDKLVMRSPPTQPLNNWLSTNTTIGNGGWRILTHFMAVSPDGDLWCVNSSNGNLYKGPIPTNDDINYLEQAEILGIGYNMYPLMSFTVDKTMENIVSCEFLLDSSKILSKSTAVVQTQTYKNNSSNLLRHNFS